MSEPGSTERGLYAHSPEGSLTRQKAAENDGTLVTVVCITYGHEEFISQALESFVGQQTDFKFKVLVGEDCGPDRTADIVRAYAEKYPDLIVPFIRETNLGPKGNLIDLCQRATSPYIAFCEGDDYWTDPLKLQKQFDYMEAHPKIKVCATRTEILTTPESHINTWFKRLPDGKMYYPDSQPNYRGQKIFRPADLIQHLLCHTSSLFFRWDYDLEFPDWYFQGFVGDWSVLLMQTGRTRVGFIPDVCSAYRVNDTSTHYNSDRTAHFLSTRLDMLTGLIGFMAYAERNFPNYPIQAVRNKIKLETANYLGAAVKLGDMERVANFFLDYPEAGMTSLPSFLSGYRDQRRLSGELTWSGYVRTVRDPKNIKLLAGFMRLVLRYQSARDKVRAKAANAGRMAGYWLWSLRPKKPNLWVFTSFRTTGYLDNSKHFFEYVSQHHPEIEAVWLSGEEDTVALVRKKGFTALQVGTAEARRALSSAGLAFTDHFRQSDYAKLPGFNHGTRFVQLWHGVGLKYMGDLRNTTVPGVRKSLDILPNPADDWRKRLRKRWRYVRYARSRELMEEYFGFLCPGPSTQATADAWGVPVESQIVAGYPRNEPLYQAESPTSPLILYAPTYRWKPGAELDMLKRLCAAAPLIEERMAALDGEFVIRLHPHTWRNYQTILGPVLRDSTRIKLDDSQDAAESLGNYSVVITDYSSIAFDYMLLDRPCVFYCFDLKDYERSEVNLGYGSEYLPGPKTFTWESTLDAMEEYLSDPTKDSEWRQRVLPEFWDPQLCGPASSERIVGFLKQRLGI